MTRLRILTAMAAAFAGMVMPTVAIAPASAAPGKWETFHDPGATEIVEDYCGVTGLTAKNDYVVDGRFKASTGRKGVSYYVEIAHSTDHWTNVATGAYVTVEFSYRFADQSVTDNGDGTLTETVRVTGNQVFYDQEGQRIGHVAGVIYHFQLVFDNAGTPTDPSDDVFLENIPLRTGGKTIDGCAVISAAIG